MVCWLTHVNPQAGLPGGFWGAMIMIDAYPRPNVPPNEYRELEVLAYQLMTQIPHHDIGKCLIIRDICTNVLRRWIEDERMARHTEQEETEEAIGANVVRLKPSDRG